MKADPISSANVELINYTNHASCQLSSILRRKPVSATLHGAVEMH